MCKNLAIYIYKKYINLIDKKEFKKLIFSLGIKNFKYINIKINLPNNKFFFGKGKILELKKIFKVKKYSLLLININLKYSQEYNIEKFLNCKVLNRTNIILNIFKNRANTNYGKLQVKLAYLKYLSTRLINRWSHLERQKGGIKYISGPGEKQIEIDRRIIKKKINIVKYKLKKNIFQRNNSEKLRKKLNIPKISLIGYTNSGKSTLFNLLTNKNYYCKNNFFSTLDVYIKKIIFFNFKYDILLSDTIGFIKNLPKNILNAFKSTLEEINKSKLIFHIIDVSNIYYNNNIDIVNNILYKINIFNIPVVLVMNKIDKIKNCNKKIDFNINKIPYRIWISAKKKIGIDFIYNVINFYFFKYTKRYKIIFPINLINKVKEKIYKYVIIINEWVYDNNENYCINVISKRKYILNLIKKYSFIKIIS